MKKILLAITAAAMFSSSGAWGKALAYTDGNSLLADCENSAPMAISLCVGYLRGVFDSYTANVSAAYISPFICHPPEGLELGQIERIVTKYLNEHPEKLHKSGASLVLAAMGEAFPCE